jgi:hypothetical protein
MSTVNAHFGPSPVINLDTHTMMSFISQGIPRKKSEQRIKTFEPKMGFKNEHNNDYELKKNVNQVSNQRLGWLEAYRPTARVTPSLCNVSNDEKKAGPPDSAQSTGARLITCCRGRVRPEQEEALARCAHRSGRQRRAFFAALLPQNNSCFVMCTLHPMLAILLLMQLLAGAPLASALWELPAINLFSPPEPFEFSS